MLPPASRAVTETVDVAAVPAGNVDCDSATDSVAICPPRTTDTAFVTPATTVNDVVPLASVLPPAFVCENKVTENESDPTGASTVAEHDVAGGGQFCIAVTGVPPAALALIDIDCVEGEIYCALRADDDATRGITTATVTGACCDVAATCAVGGAALPPAPPPPPQPTISAAANSAAGSANAGRR